MIKKIRKRFQYRIEHDPLGEVQVPRNAYYGAHTERARNNFQISTPCNKELLYAIATVKIATAKANPLLKKQKNAIIKAAHELLNGKFDRYFVTDQFQAGAGTPMHMNINEILANRATELIGGKRGRYTIHPTDHVNMGQSTNNVIPTALRVLTLQKHAKLLSTATKLQKALEKKARQWKNLKKSGRTHLQDAVPITLGQEFSGYAQAVKKDIQHLKQASQNLTCVGLGGNAIGTGINTKKSFAKTAITNLAKLTKLPLKETKNHFDITQHHTDFLDYSNALTTIATDINTFCNDLRLLSSGPSTGLNELHLPEVEAGSSIMPGKVNPSICECMNMICFQLLGNNNSIIHAANAGQLELNIFLPLIAKNLLESLDILTNGIEMLVKKCIEHMTPNKELLKWYHDHSVGIATALNPILGYDVAAMVAQEAVRTGTTVKEIIIAKKILPKSMAKKLFS